MAGNKNGIFDPWRQSPPPSAPGPDIEGHVGTDLDEDAPPMTAVRYAGKRAGMTIWGHWSTDPDTRAVAAQARVTATLAALWADPSAAAVLRRHGVKEGSTIDEIAMALRAIGNHPVLKSAGINPFVI